VSGKGLENISQQGVAGAKPFPSTAKIRGLIHSIIWCKRIKPSSFDLLTGRAPLLMFALFYLNCSSLESVFVGSHPYFVV
jgi:hypothetical protein